MSTAVVIVGAGQAGLQVAVSLRQGGFTGSIMLIGKEPHLPYQRPPLSKQVLKGEWSPEKCLLRQMDYLEQHGIEFRSGTTAESLDTTTKTVHVAGQDAIEYEQLVICTGPRLNRIELTGSHLPGIHYLRSLDDATSLKAALAPDQRVVVAGGGYIGLEVAASARSLGCKVDVIEAQHHIMQRSALPPIQDFLLARHQKEGVGVHLGRLMSEILGSDKVRAVAMDDGTLIDADIVLKGIGVRPDLRWLDGSGIETDRGVKVDQYCRTNIEHVYAAGDVCETQHPLYDRTIVLESVQNAVGQGKIVAAGILGNHVPYDEVPWFWSEQYDCRFQMAGLSQAGDDLVIRKTDPSSVSILSIGTDRLNAIQCINAPRDYMAARKIIAATDQVDLERLKNPEQELKELL